MQIIIHRGAQEIGGNCIEIRNEGHAMLFDIGLPLDFNDTGQAFSELIEDGTLPDIPGIYAEDSRPPSIDALVISHSHLDHYGILPFIKKEIPIYMGPAGWRIISSAAPFLHTQSISDRKIIPIRDNETFVKSGFSMTPYLMDHSAFDAYAFHIASGGKSIIYTGDFRAHGRKPGALPRFLSRVPHAADVLLVEGTRLSRESEKTELTEQNVETQVSVLCSETKNLVLGYCSSQNIDRIVSFYRAAKKAGRKLVVDIYTAHILQAAAESGNTIPVPGKFDDLLVYFPHRISTKVAKHGNANLLHQFQPFKITRQEIARDRKKILMIVRPSVRRELELIGELEGSVLIYSLWEGYLDRSYVSDFVSWLGERGCGIEKIHSSGHADPEVLKHVIETLKPATIIPIHTTAPEKYLELFPNTKLCKNGQVVTV